MEYDCFQFTFNTNSENKAQKPAKTSASLQVSTVFGSRCKFHKKELCGGHGTNWLKSCQPPVFLHKLAIFLIFAGKILVLMSRVIDLT